MTLTKLPILNLTSKTIHASSQVKLQVTDFQAYRKIENSSNEIDLRFWFCLFVYGFRIEHVRERSTERRDSIRYQIQTRFQVKISRNSVKFLKSVFLVQFPL